MQTITRILIALIILSAVSMAVVPSAYGAAQSKPSFSCSEARSDIEKAICTDPLLGRYDARLASDYQEVLDSLVGHAAVKKMVIARQRHWLAWRDSHCSKASFICLVNAYLVRITRLESERDNPYLFTQTSRLETGKSKIILGARIRCLADRVAVDFSGPYESPEYSGLRGNDLATHHVDCRLLDGTSIRFQTGMQYDPRPSGYCGASPPLRLSIWVNKRKLVSGVAFTNSCEDPYLASLSINAGGLRFCLDPNSDMSGVDDSVFTKGHGACRHISMSPSAVIDRTEFPARGALMPMLGTYSVSGRQPQLCARMLLGRWITVVELPGDLRRPHWLDVGRKLHQPDLSKLHYNAMTLYGGGWQESHFDLTNSGKIEHVYRIDGSTNMFDGTVFGVGDPSVLVEPFELQGPRPTPKGIFPFPYNHAKVFFDHGTTYLFLEETSFETPSVVSLHGNEQREECAFHQTGVHF